jgi:hypothetical protein
MIPTIDVPTYDLKLPSNGQEIKVRPFLVKEEKMLLMAVSTDDAQEIIKTTKQVINNCLISKDVNIDTLPFFDVDYLFIALRAKSVGEKISVGYVCQTKTDGIECGGKFKVDLDIANIDVVKDESIDMDIAFNSDLIFRMKYPSYSVIKSISEKDTGIEKTIKIVAACIERVFTKGQYYTSKDMTPSEMITLVESLTNEQFMKLEEFTMNFPYFEVVGSGKCTKCGKEHSVRYNDFVNFFQ